MPAPFRTRRMVEFADTDMAGIMHFSAFFRFMEGAEHALLRSLGLSVYGIDDPAGGDAVISFPRVGASCDFSSPARCEDQLDIDVSVKKLGRSSVTYGFRLSRDGDELAAGQMTSVCCRMRTGQKPEPIPLPDDVASLLRRYAVTDGV
ncbi:1,4-dihydroxy-2-naphthoyl-CoA hydrolase [Botrimarina colliarenosi]|uniref:1,4-dihydroxy-2-naphthoyl-CoA hydrolase n=1 Tax=Botrimarina colliarenosi TaxID=2528001 RepID=A0A5C6ACD3_9BACT|nr:thioesterase family protein [Botrimarina colliarenosi]TWT97080.1 1,4-dihydroxy-2-naphthoyl-CoA hydrolase [Botrimarina colliarenosi]